MSEKVKEAIYENVVKPSQDQRQIQLTGQVKKTYFQPLDEEDTEYFNRNLADIQIKDPTDGTVKTIPQVPIVVDSLNDNISGSKIKPGDKVKVDFYNGNKREPRITGKIYTDPKQRHKQMSTKTGVLTPDAISFFL